MQNLLNDLMFLLERDLRLVAEGKLLKNKIVELALALDAGLIKLLLSHAAIKKHFFVEVENVLVFDKIKFQRFVSNKQFLPDSYTAYKNKIGLTTSGEYLTESKEVVLAWPYKDCVLEGGQDKEDAKRNELFWNETLAPDQIDRLLAPKVLTSFKRYDQDGEHAVTELSLDDNLIIKGNNLLALHTLKEVYAGKVKLIYIDPPYNTGGDSFKYNDSFNHSTWLSFMRNRLEAAKCLLRSDGIIMVNLDDVEFAYQKVMCDQIFGRENFICTFLWKKKSTSTNVEGVQVSSLCDYVLTYARTTSGRVKQRVRLKETRSYPCSDALGNYRTTIVEKKDAGGYKRETMKFEILGQQPRDGKRWQIGKTLAEELEKTNRFLIDEGVIKLKIYDFDDKDTYSANPSLLENHGSSDSASKHVNIELFNTPELFSNPKPEELLSYLIEATTEEFDIVLDFHLGSGTTAAVAHKMNRRYIGVEQMDYIQTITLERLKKVIAGEQGGISKSVNWQGGGSFVYCELSQANQEFIDQIQAATSSNDLQVIWQVMQEKAFLSYQLNPKIIDANASEFSQLVFADQQRFLIEVLDKNLLYVPYSEMDDASYAVSDADKALNCQFFSLK